MSEIGLKKKWIEEWMGRVSSMQICLDVWNFFNFARPLNPSSESDVCVRHTLTYTDGTRTERIKIFIIVVDP